MREKTLREKRRQASRWFVTRVLLLLVLIGGVAYAAWFGPAGRKAQAVVVNTGTEH